MAVANADGLLTLEEYHLYGVRAEEGVPDMWMPARRVDGIEGEWVQIANTAHPRYRSHVAVFGPPQWGSTNDSHEFRPA